MLPSVSSLIFLRNTLGTEIVASVGSATAGGALTESGCPSARTKVRVMTSGTTRAPIGPRGRNACAGGEVTCSAGRQAVAGVATAKDLLSRERYIAILGAHRLGFLLREVNAQCMHVLG